MGTLSNLNGITEPQIPSEIARDAEVTNAIASHEAKTDPHPIYLTQTEGDGRYRQSAVALADADIPAAIARDLEVTSAIANHVSATDPHPIYLTQTEGDGRYRQSAVALADADISAAIARDLEVTNAIANHVNATDPHPSLWTRITNAFLALTGGQMVAKNNPAMSAFSYVAGQNHLELRTTDGSNPIIGFHRGGVSATALYHLGYGNNSLRIRNADGFDGAIVHDGNIGVRSVVVYGVAPSSASQMGQQIPLPAEVAIDKIVSLSAIAKVNSGVADGFSYIPPSGLAWSQGYRYSVHAFANSLILGTGIFGESFGIFGVPVRIVVGYLP